MLRHPASTIAFARLFHSDPCDWFAAVALAMNNAQIAHLVWWAAHSGQVGWAGFVANVTPARALYFLAAWAVGMVFKVSIFTAIGKRGVYYGSKFGHAIPWTNGFPFSVTGARLARPPRCLRQAGHANSPALPTAAHPQYLGSSLLISGAGVLLYNPAFPGHALVPAWWVFLYVATGVLEEGLCASHDPSAPLPKDFDPFMDHQTRPLVAAELARLAVMAPVAAARLLSAALLASASAATLLLMEARHRFRMQVVWRATQHQALSSAPRARAQSWAGSQPERQALVARATRHASHALLLLLGITVRAPGYGADQLPALGGGVSHRHFAAG